MGFHRFSALTLTFLVLASTLSLGFTVSPQSSQLEDPYGLLGLKVEYEYPDVSLAKYRDDGRILLWPDPPKPLFLAKYNFLLKEILSPDKKWYSYLVEELWRGRILDDPYHVSKDLRIYIDRVIGDPRKESFYYRFSWHVTGYDGSYYTVVLRLKMYYYDFVNKKAIYEFSEIVETVKVSVYDRRVIYDGVDVGIWPFWLMPWERYEGATVKLAEISPFFELNNVTDPLKTLNVTLDAKVGRADLGGILARYLEDEIGVSLARILNAKVESSHPSFRNKIFGCYEFTGEDMWVFLEAWVEAYYRMTKKYYPQIKIERPKIISASGCFLKVPNNLYDAVTGAALTVWGANDVLLTVIPSPLLDYGPPVTSGYWVITREPLPVVERTTETATTTTRTITAVETTTTTTPATSPVTTTQTETATRTVTPEGETITRPTVTYPEETPTTTRAETTTPIEPARDRTAPAIPPITPAKPPEPRRVEEAPKILSFEIAIAALTALAVSAAIITIIFRRRAGG
ncbi:MAG: hypothetical protein P3X22_007865 [Thermoprotei archaeon]|nr:hypothetical protein [Thermoprotei archaeon]